MIMNYFASKWLIINNGEHYIAYAENMEKYHYISVITIRPIRIKNAFTFTFILQVFNNAIWLALIIKKNAFLYFFLNKHNFCNICIYEHHSSVCMLAHYLPVADSARELRSLLSRMFPAAWGQQKRNVVWKND